MRDQFLEEGSDVEGHSDGVGQAEVLAGGGAPANAGQTD